MRRQAGGSEAEGPEQRPAGRRRLSLAIGPALLLAGCAVGPGPALPEPPAGAVRFSLLALGDTGRLPRLVLGRTFHRQSAVARGLIAEDARQPADALVLLGDNFYDDGLEPARLVHQVRENLVRPYCRFVDPSGPRFPEVASVCRLDAARRHVLPIHAVLGNHDYNTPRSPSLQRREVPRFVPNWHVPAGLVEVVEFPAGVSLVLLDSEALVWGADPASLVRALRRSRGPWRVLAAHRPVAWAQDGQPGEPGGLRRYRETVLAAIREAGVPVQLAVAGHEHNLQIVEMDPPGPSLLVVAGSGSRVRDLDSSNPRMRFGRASPGFARIDLAPGAAGEELVVSLFATSSVPALERGAPEAVARWSVAANGEVREWSAAAAAR